MALGLAAIPLLLLLAAGAARAGSASLFAGPLLFEVGEGFSCSAVNVSTRTITAVVVTLRKADGLEVTSFGCPTLDPFEACPLVGASGSALGLSSCEVTSAQGAKGLRGTLQNLVNGGTSDAR
jgi:hypothetical protein